MRYSILTASLLRPSLLKTCQSIDLQTNGDWEHLIAADCPKLPNHIPMTEDSRRRVICCDMWHNNFGNSCRYNLWEHAKGDYILYCDDDNFYIGTEVFTALEEVTQAWAMFGMRYHGQDSPARRGVYDANTIMHKKEVGRYPNVDDYAADQQLGCELSQFSCQLVDKILIEYPKAQRGK